MRFSLHNPRDMAQGPHRAVDDSPYGGGPGMVMQLDPLVQSLKAIEQPGRILVMSASGKPFTQSLAAELTNEPGFTLVCGRYEGIDARLAAMYPVEMINVGDAVLNGGEVAASYVIEAVTRLLPGFMGKISSADEESFSAGLLEYPHYTRPEHYEGHSVPAVLTSGDHARIARWRREMALQNTWNTRPDMLATAPLSREDALFLQTLPRNRLGRNLHIALTHSPVMLDAKKSGTSSLTNLDIHDIARCSRSYGVAQCLVVTPIADQQKLLHTLTQYWTQGAGSRSNPDRAEALNLVQGVASLEEAIACVERYAGQRPLVIGTSARLEGALPPGDLRAMLTERPVLLVFGTAQGLAPEALALCDHIARPLRFMDEYNHLPVRGAAAILLDRILGDWY